MNTFIDPELKLIRKLASKPQQTVLQIKKPCPTHSVCTPLPLFQVYKIDDSTFAFTPPADAKPVAWAVTYDVSPAAIQRIAKEKKQP